jgi:hypothetical protein
MSEHTTEGKDPHDSGTDTTTDSDADTHAPDAFVEARVMGQQARLSAAAAGDAVKLLTSTEDLTAQVMCAPADARELVAELEAAIATAEAAPPLAPEEARHHD